jgi:hypothetical protein
MSRLELHIDVLDQVDQRALALSDLLPGQLVQAVLDEFRELEYLGAEAEAYHLVSLPDGAPLAEDRPIGVQLASGARLALLENEAEPPTGAQRALRPAYLRELSTGQVYPLGWFPAIIGRATTTQPMNELVAVDLQAFATGLRVSRRHVILYEQGGGYFVENMSSNPASLLRASRSGDGSEQAVELTETRAPLLSGDVIRLERSAILLKFIVRDPAAPPRGPAGAPADGPIEEGV